MTNISQFPNQADLPKSGSALVTTLEELLSEARAGRLRSLAFTAATEESIPTIGWAGDSSDLTTLSMGVSILWQRFHDQFNFKGSSAFSH